MPGYTIQELRAIAAEGREYGSRKTGPGASIINRLCHALDQAADRLERASHTSRPEKPSVETPAKAQAAEPPADVKGGGTPTPRDGGGSQ